MHVLDAEDESSLQGRARPSLAELYSWRYQALGNLPNVTSTPEYVRGNPGLAYDYQFIDVPDLQGRGESEPVPHFYQVCKTCRGESMDSE